MGLSPLSLKHPPHLYPTALQTDSFIHFTLCLVLKEGILIFIWVLDSRICKCQGHWGGSPASQLASSPVLPPTPCQLPSSPRTTHSVPCVFSDLWVYFPLLTLTLLGVFDHLSRSTAAWYLHMDALWSAQPKHDFKGPSFPNVAVAADSKMVCQELKTSCRVSISH